MDNIAQTLGLVSHWIGFITGITFASVIIWWIRQCNVHIHNHWW